MTIVCIEGDKTGYFPPCPPSVDHLPKRDKRVSSGTPVTMRVSALFALFRKGVPPLQNKSKRESGVLYTNNSRTRMAAGFQEETALSLFGCGKGAA